MQALEGLLADAEQLAGSVHSTAELSERVSKVSHHCKTFSLLIGLHHSPIMLHAACAGTILRGLAYL